MRAAGRAALSWQQFRGPTRLTPLALHLPPCTPCRSDLFWAIRGGGASFGVVTEWVIRPFVPPESEVTVVEVNANCSAPNIAWLLDQFMSWQPWEALPRTWASIDFRVGERAWGLMQPRGRRLQPLAASASHPGLPRMRTPPAVNLSAPLRRADGTTCGVHMVFWGPEEAARKELSGVAFVKEAPQAVDADIIYTETSYEDHIRLWTLYSCAREAACMHADG